MLAVLLVGLGVFKTRSGSIYFYLYESRLARGDRKKKGASPFELAWWRVGDAGSVAAPAEGVLQPCHVAQVAPLPHSGRHMPKP